MLSDLEAIMADTRRLVSAARMPRPRRGAGRLAEPELPRGEYVDLPGRGTTFVRLVDGPVGSVPVVLLHGWSWTADLNFASLFGPLGAHHPVIAPDVRLHGRGLRVPGDFRATDATDDVIALLDALEVESALFCGYSMGGVLTVDAALRHPERVAGMIVQSAAACYTTTKRERAMWGALRALMPAARRGAGPDVSARYLAGALPGNDDLAARWDWVRQELRRTSLIEMLTVAAEVARADLRPALATPPTMPGEFLLTTADRICPPAAQRALADRLAVPVVEVDTDHELPISHPDRYADITLNAVSRVTATIQAEGTYVPTA